MSILRGEIKTVHIRTEKEFEHHGYRCVINLFTDGHRSAYVGLTKNDAYYQIRSDRIPMGEHERLTHSGNMIPFQEDKSVWWVGFDTTSGYGGADFESARSLFGEDAFEEIAAHEAEYNKRTWQIRVKDRFPEMFEEMKKIGMDAHFQKNHRDLGYCVRQCELIAERMEKEKDAI